MFDVDRDHQLGEGLCCNQTFDFCLPYFYPNLNIILTCFESSDRLIRVA